MKPINGFLPNAISPPHVEGPSAITCPTLTSSPLFTKGRWFMLVPWLLRWNFASLYLCIWPDAVLMIISFDAERSTIPSSSAITQLPESTAAFISIPVPTAGASVTRSGTAWRCMLEPMRARLASSFSKKGIIAVATENTILGDTSIRSIFFFSNSEVSSRKRPDTFFLTKWPSSSKASFACATM